MKTDRRLPFAVGILALGLLGGCAAPQTTTKNFVPEHAVTGEASAEDRSIVNTSNQRMFQPVHSTTPNTPNTGVP